MGSASPRCSIAPNGMFSGGADNPLFSPRHLLARNFKALNTPEVRAKLIVLARIADVTGHHLPIRGVLCLLSNALLGHPDARDRVMRPGAEADALPRAGTHTGGIPPQFVRRESYRHEWRSGRYTAFSRCSISVRRPQTISMNCSFLARGIRSLAAYRELVAADPFLQRNPDFDGLAQALYSRRHHGEEETRKTSLLSSPARGDAYSSRRPLSFPGIQSVENIRLPPCTGISRRDRKTP